MLRGPTPIAFFLAPPSHQQSRLLDQASLSSPPHQKAPRDLNPQDCTGGPTCSRKEPRILKPKIVLEAQRTSVKCTPNLPTNIPAKHYTLTICTSSSSSSRSINSTLASYIEVLKWCIRYPLSNYKGIWNSQVESLPIDSATVGQFKGILIHFLEGSCSDYCLIPYFC